MEAKNTETEEEARRAKDKAERDEHYSDLAKYILFNACIG